MRYKSFYIKNYKGIKELSIDLDRDPRTNIITLVGLNESGKTTILEALSLLSAEPETEQIHRLIPKSQKFKFTGTIEILAKLSLDDKDKELIGKFCISKGFTSVRNIDDFTHKISFKFTDSEFIPSESGRRYKFSLAGRKRGDSKVAIYGTATPEYTEVQEFISKKLVPPIIYYPNFLFDFPKKIYLEKSEGENKEQETYREVINDIMDTLNEGMNISDHIINRLRNKTEGNVEALESTIDRMSLQITNIVFSAWGQLFDSKGKEIRLKPALEDSTGLAYLEVKIKEGAEQFQISERSLGFKWFFTFLLFTEFRKNRSSENGEILFLLDEPASNLHSNAQKKLLVTFEKLVSKCKLIYTTHSHHLINPKWLSGAYVVKNKAIDYESEFDSVKANTDIEATLYKQFVVNNPQQRTYFQPILDAIEYSPSNLEEVPNITLTEGKNDYYTFKYVNEVIFTNEFSSIRFYPGNGADRNDQIIATYLAWGRGFTILLDGDKAGEEAKKRYIKEFGKIVQSNILTLRTIDAAFSYATEKLFTEEEQLAVIRTFDPLATTFDKSKFNTALQNLYIQEQSVELSEPTLKKFRKIFEFIK